MAKVDWPRDARDAGPFKESLKCCTYTPFLPNFSLGRLNTDQYARAESAVALGKAAFTPIGLVPLIPDEPMPDEPESDSKAEPIGFGQDDNAKCPFLTEASVCSIWRDRPTVCRTYFCVSDKQETWQAHEERGNDLEWLIAHELLWDLGFTEDDKETFAEWTGREREFFIECAKRAGEF